MSSVPFHARQAEFKHSTAVSIASSTELDSQFSGGSSFSGVIKDVTISPPEGDVEVISFLGEDGSGFQNQKFEESAFGEATIEGTLIVDSAEALETIAYGSGTTVSSTHTRYRAGDGNRPTDAGILCNLDNGTDEVNVVLNNLRVTKLGDIKPTGTDGHWEMDFSAKCLASDYYLEYKD